MVTMWLDKQVEVDLDKIKIEVQVDEADRQGDDPADEDDPLKRFGQEKAKD